MASPVLHIKDSYYFDVPKALWRVQYADKAQFPDVWVRCDPDYLAWDARQVYQALPGDVKSHLPPIEELLHSYEHWQHDDHAHAGRPFASFLESQDSFAKLLKDDTGAPTAFSADWAGIRGQDRVADFKASTVAWDVKKIEGYNRNLSGKILIPQPFGRLKNLYEKDSGFCVSKFMLIEVVVALCACLIFSWLGRRVEVGGAPKGRLWNLLETFVVFVRDGIARPAIGEHDAEKYMPLLLSVFFFILGCNLMGMLPWVGAPTGSWGVTAALAAVTFSTVVLMGVAKFGPIGFVLNQAPHMDLPFVLAIVIKPMILAIELLGLCIKHAVLSIRLLANIFAGHIVLLSIMTLAFSVSGAMNPLWPVVAPVVAVGSALLSILELMVCFLQAFVFTLLSALFIGAATHHH